jgi:hypothetical protein
VPRRGGTPRARAAFRRAARGCRFARALGARRESRHARRCLAICEEHGIGDFDIAFAHEAVARAHAVAGDRDAAARHAERARAAAAGIAEDEDREMVLADLAALPSAGPAPAP